MERHKLIHFRSARVASYADYQTVQFSCILSTDCVVTPNSEWGGWGLLGCRLRFDSYEDADENMIRVLEVEDKSPAAKAGLIPFKDYLLGSLDQVFTRTYCIMACMSPI